MASNSQDEAAASTSPNYCQLDRSINEIRLLKILPPEASSKAQHDPLALSSEIVRCELQYESLNEIARRTSMRANTRNLILACVLQGISSMRFNDGESDVGALMELLGSGIDQQLTVDTNSKHEINLQRKEALSSIYEESKETMQKWLLGELKLLPLTFDNWLKTWIWTPLSGDESHLEEESPGYCALSYVWRDQPTATFGGKYKAFDRLAAASGSTARQILEEGSNIPSDIIQAVFGTAEDAASNMTQVILDGKRVLVGKNLEMALRTLREIPEVQRGTRIWVDALCINQNDIGEKNYEVKRMGDIYKTADRVISYLGEERDLAGQILEFMDRVGTLGVLSRATEVVAPAALEFLRNIQTDVVIAMTKLLSRPYWSRIWIIQEIALGGEKSIVICGARRFPLTNLLRCGKIFNEGMGMAFWNFNMRLELNKESDGNYLTMDDLKAGITKLQMLRDAHIDCQDTNRKVPLSNTLWFRIPSTNNATDPRDLIYGMINILPGKLTTLINVDYSPTNSFVNVMAEFARAHIQSTQSLAWILHRPYLPFFGYKTWPTWVPNLAQQFSSDHWDWALIPGCNACPKTPFMASFEKELGSGKYLLICKGLRIDTLNQVTRSESMVRLDRIKEMLRSVETSINADNWEERIATIEELRRMSMNVQTSMLPDAEVIEPVELPLSQTTHKYGDVGGLKTALTECFRCLDLIFDSGHSIFDIPFDMGDDYDLDTNRMLPSRVINVPGSVMINALRDAFADFKLWDRKFKDLFPARLSEVDPGSFSIPKIENRKTTLARFFTTCGGYVGSCIYNIQPGDEVFLLSGCNMPVILRRSTVCTDAYELQGGVYIPGVMKGEALAGDGALGDTFQTIRIC